ATREDAATSASRMFFFFQAEDGIRDKLVTGVQTCALPISSPPGTTAASSARTTSTSTNSWANPHEPRRRLRPAVRVRLRHQPPRSEERRVGKEGRSRWGPEH